MIIINNQFDLQPPKKKNNTLIIIICVAAAILLIALVIKVIFGFTDRLIGLIGMFDDGYREGYNEYADYDNIAVLEISGTISSESDGYYNHDWIMGTIEELTDDDKNKGLCLIIDTPGGSAYQTDEVYDKLLGYKKTGRPVYVYMKEQCTSGGYFISCAADKIYANRNTLTGSIGVIMNTVFDLTDLLDKYGIKAATISSGENKGMGDYFTPLTDEQKKILQDVCDEAFDIFVSVVAEGRGMSEKEVRKLADGRIYTAKQALENGLIDGIMTYDEFFDEVAKSISDENELPFEFYSCNYSYGYIDMFEYNSGKTEKNEETETIEELLKNPGHKLWYYSM